MRKTIHTVGTAYGWLRQSLTMLAMACFVLVHAQPTDLIISEYVEGSSSEKYLELYNGTGTAINLADYQLRLYANGSTAPTTVGLTGSLAAGASIVYRNSLATTYPAAIVNAAINFNGDDAIALYKISTASYVDIFGQIGCDPGSAWTGTGISTVDRTLRRKINVCGGVTSNPGGACGVTSFATLMSEWDNFANNVISGLGTHTMVCGPAVNFSTASGSHPENAGAVVVNLTISPAAAAAGTITIGVANGAGATYGAAGDYTTTPAVAAGSITLNVAAGATTASFSVNIVDDVATEADETITFTITGASGSMSAGAGNTHVFTIVDNDVTPTINFSTLSISVLENAGVQNFQLSIVPPAPAAGSIIVQVTNGPGATYGFGNDYLSNPGVIGGNITVNFAAGATTAAFSITVLNDVVVEDTETVTFTITGVPAGSVIGGNNTSILEIGDNDSPPTILEPGDLVVVGVNANTGGCSGLAGDDEVSFFCFKPIVPGTTLILTDNGYERCNAGLWGNSEGTVRMTRTGMAIPAGKVITFRFNNSVGAGNVTGAAPDNAWTCTSLNGNTSVNMNQGGDPIFFMQGGTWTTGTAGAHNATYDGTVLFGFTTNPTFPWSATCPSPAGNQRSNLPPGIECFSMSPTLATDFNKYVGPMTSATQRNWIIRIDDTNNWSTYGSCADYNSGGFNWLTSPIMPITIASFEPGKWTGAVSQDWFDCKNWDDARVPTMVTPVVIDETSLNNCSVGLDPGISPGGTGECASLSLSFDAGFSRNLFIQPNSTLNVNGPVTVERTSGTGIISVNVLANATLSATDLFLESVNAGSGEARFNCATATSMTNLEGHVTIGAGGRIDLGIGGTIKLGGNWNNLASDAMFVENTGNVVFNGGVDQNIITTGFEEVFYNLRVDTPGSDLLPAVPVAVRGQLDLLDGLIHTSATELLSMRAGSSVINASDLSYVHGPVQKIGLTPFTFPVGKEGSLRPCGLRNYSGAGTDAFIAEYFPESPIATFGDLKDPMLNHISDCEYWTIDRSIGNANAIVELTWDTPESCGVTDLPTLRVARFDGTLWLDRGNGGAVGDNTSGTIPTAAVQTLFSPWTLASSFASNPLPVSLLSFTAHAEGDMVRLDWSTATEINNEYFTIERSAEGEEFFSIVEVPGAINSTILLDYTALDRSPLQGMNYYRLRQTDLDGNFTYSPVLGVMMSGNGRELIVFGDRDMIHAVHDLGAGSHYEILDMTGRLVHQGVSDQDGRTMVPAGSMPRGAYIFKIQEGDRFESTRFIY